VTEFAFACTLQRKKVSCYTWRRLTFTNLSVLQLCSGDALALLTAPAFDALTGREKLTSIELSPGLAPLSAALRLEHNAAQLRFFALDGVWPAQPVIALALSYAHIEMQGARLLQAETMLQLSDADFESICTLLREVLPAELTLHVHAGNKLSLIASGNYAEPPHSPWLDHALGSRLADALVQPLQWAKLQNDLQMELAQLPLQQTRTNAGLAPINCVWLWGRSPVADTASPALRLRVHSEDSILRAMQASNELTVQTQGSLDLFDLRAELNPHLPNAARVWLWSLDGRACLLERSPLKRWLARLRP
jgi:hypothetical protein